MAKGKKYDNSLKVRKKYEGLAFMGKFGKYEYSEPRLLKDMDDEELAAFYYAHKPVTRQKYLVGEPKKKTEAKKEDLPTKPEE